RKYWYFIVISFFKIRCSPDENSMSKLIDTNKPESRNWLKQWRAVCVTREALLPIVSEEAAQLHGDILIKAKVPACTTCSFKDVQKRTARCPYHVVLRDELVKEHAYGHTKGIGALTLKNTKTENWAHSPWEIAKVFMPSGYEDKTTIEETDFNGIAAFIINCKHFHGKITGTICEKARKVVNHIRHMPDISSAALTDQDTTECIDNLYALLNEPGLKIRPEAIQARTQLDELKTLKDGNVYYSICQKLHDEFEQKLTDIERKLHANEIDTERAKESIHSLSQQFLKDREEVLRSFERISNDAKQDLTRTKNSILLSIEEERRSFKENITSLEKRTVQRIE
ncbi:CX038-like protein, partial [Mya arenaria]